MACICSPSPRQIWARRSIFSGQALFLWISFLSPMTSAWSELVKQINLLSVYSVASSQLAGECLRTPTRLCITSSLGIWAQTWCIQIVALCLHTCSNCSIVRLHMHGHSIPPLVICIIWYGNYKSHVIFMLSSEVAMTLSFVLERELNIKTCWTSWPF